MQGHHVNYEASYPQKDGSVNWYYVRLFPIKHTDQTVFGVMLAVSDITEKKNLEQKIIDQKVQEQKMVIRAILAGEERERNKLGQELHDNVGQILAGIKIFLSTGRNAKDGNENIITESLELIDSAIEEIRSLSRGKVTPMVKVDLKELLQLLIDRLDGTQHIKINLEYKGKEQSISDDLKLNIYRIIQEQLNNVLKHANAQNVYILIETSENNIHIMLKDDGKGFDVNSKKSGIGLANIINRVETFNGNIVIESSFGKGCKIIINVPV